MAYFRLDTSLKDLFKSAGLQLGDVDVRDQSAEAETDQDQGSESHSAETIADEIGDEQVVSDGGHTLNLVDFYA